MATPYLKTSDGFEMQFGVNHLAHFALTALLWPGMRDKRTARILNLSSVAHHFGKIRFEDIHWDNGYKKWGAYGMSKLANLLFTTELARRLKEIRLDSYRCSQPIPAMLILSLQAKCLMMAGSNGKAGLFNLANRLLAQSGAMGALPSLYAATAPGVESGSFYGPSGLYAHERLACPG